MLDNFAIDNWQLNNRHYENILVASEKDGDDIDAIVKNIYLLIIQYAKHNSINEDVFTKALAKIEKQTGLTPSEYIATNAKYSYKSGSSFYDNIEIEITFPSNEIQKGIIRISDHEVDLNNWAENNSKYDFGISFVFKEKSNEWQGNNIIEISNRQIIIYEFTYIVKRNQLNFLNYLISEILNIKRTKKFLANSAIAGKILNAVTNKIIESISGAIKKVLNI